MFSLKDQFEEDQIDIDNKMLLAVSGGPDSMYLLSLLKNKNIVVAHVNYNKRENSKYDENLVRNFCSKYNIPCFVLDLKQNNSRGNFQNLARVQRYDFFKKVYQENGCNYLILAHHKDDFLETAIMQEKSNRNVLFYGIKQKNILFNMNIYRPFLHTYWKQEILNLCKQNQIEYALDYTNELNIYTRNIIRNELKSQSLETKEKIYDLFFKKNKNYEILEKQINEEFCKWQELKFNCDFLKSNKLWKNLIYKFINVFYFDINLSTKKMINIYEFITSDNRTSTYKLDDKNYLYKKKNELIIINKR